MAADLLFLTVRIRTLEHLSATPTMNEAAPATSPESTSRAAPGLLIAVPGLLDPNFFHTVILMIDHSQEGAMGLVLNRPGTTTIAELCADQGITSDRELPVRVGGPVAQERVWVLHNSRENLEDRVEITEGIWLSYTQPTLARLAQSDARFLLLAGHAGWGPGQLECEIEDGAWLLFPVSEPLILDSDPEVMWEQLIVRFGNLGSGIVGLQTRTDLN